MSKKPGAPAGMDRDEAAAPKAKVATPTAAATAAATDAKADVAALAKSVSDLKVSGTANGGGAKASASTATATATATAAAAATAGEIVTPGAAAASVSKPQRPPWATMPLTNKEEARAIMTKIQAEIFKLFDHDGDGYLTEKDYLYMDSKLSDGENDPKRSADTFNKMCDVMQIKTAGKITPIEYIKFKLRELDTKNFKIQHLQHAAMTFAQQLTQLQHKMDVHTYCPVDATGKHIEMQNIHHQPHAPGGGHGHSHGGKPCHGHGGAGGHGHSHGGAGGHGHSHGGHGGHGHSHGGSDHGHSHGDDHGHSHSHGGDDHGHSHGGDDDHGHSHSAAAAKKKTK